MVILCTNCGTPIREGARYCNNCGTLTSSHPFSSKTTSASNNNQNLGAGRSDNTRPAIREQIAHLPQSPARPVRRFAQDEAPSWMSQLDKESHASSSRTFSNRYQSDSVPQLDFPAPEPLPRSNSSQPELRVKVWQQDEPISSPGILNEDADSVLPDEVVDLAMSSFIASSTHAPVSDNGASSPSRPAYNSRVEELERMDTAHLGTPAYNPPARPLSHAGFDQSFDLAQQPTSSLARNSVPPVSQHYGPAFPNPALPQSTHRNTPSARSIQSQPLVQTPPSHVPVSTVQRKRGRKPLVLVIGLLAILILGGIAVWVGAFHPFAVPDIVQPQRNFSSSQFAFSLQYPTGWNTQVNTSASSVYFADSSNTAQFTVTVAAASGKDAGQYVRQLATQLKLTNIKSASTLSFGGASWQQIQGNALFGGANYSETILATIHNNQLYTITQAAPVSTYTQEEQVVFSTMRSSFKFI